MTTTTFPTSEGIGSRVFAFLQRLGQSLMLPIAILPVAGLLLRLGANDLLDLPFMFEAGNAIFSNLAVIFAIGVAVGWAKENHGAAALSAFIALSIMNAAAPKLALLLWGNAEGTDMAALGGIFSGLLAGMLYNRFYRIELPSYLAFFGGRRFVPIITGFAALVMAFFVALLWPSVGKLFSDFGSWTVTSGSWGLFFYGFFNRLLIVTGLHHILNNLVWFQFGEFTNAAGEIVKGDLSRFFASDPSAGGFMSGFFPVMMFGLPAAALAMYTIAYPQNKKRAMGILFSAAFTALLTGVTEPIEFAFMFLAPFLYVIHAVLTGLALVVMNLLGVKLGFSFSAGLFDYILNYGISTKPYMLLIVGPVYAVLYYFLFVFFIKTMKIPTIGREEKNDTEGISVSADSRALQFLTALGGGDNIIEITSCATRLRLTVQDSSLVDEAWLGTLGARGVLTPTSHSLQVIVGTEAEILADGIKLAWKQNCKIKEADITKAKEKILAASQDTAVSVMPTKEDAALAEKILKALKKNRVQKVSLGAGNRLVLECSRNVDEATAKLKEEKLQVLAKENLLMITLGKNAKAVEQVLLDLLP